MTNAVRFAGDPARTLRYSERANASLISLSLRHFREVLLIEVCDTNDTPRACPATATTPKAAGAWCSSAR